MGRTLHYSITKERGMFSRQDKQAMIDIAEKYNSGTLKDIWSCENYYFIPYNYYPNWNGMFKDVNPDEAWKQINGKWKELVVQGKADIDIYEELHASKYIQLFDHLDSNKYQGFTKVQGNELNALLVYHALIELSLAIPNTMIHLRDEGHFLFCPVNIRQGKAKPLFSEMKETLRYYYELILLKDNDILPQINKHDLPAGILKDLHLEDNPYDKAEIIKWINEKMRDMNEVYKRIKKHIISSYHCIHNIENHWFEPELLCRRINPKDFEDTKCDAGTLMAGFYGEYFKLTDKDEESESYKTIARLQKMMGIKGDSKMKLEILSKTKK